MAGFRPLSGQRGLSRGPDQPTADPSGGGVGSADHGAGDGAVADAGHGAGHDRPGVASPARRRLAGTLPVTLAALTVGLQIAYPLAGEHGRTVLTVLTVLTFCATSVGHAARSRGRAWAAAFVAVCLPVAFAAEVVGVATGAPFGSYRYSGQLGPRLAGVPIIIPLAWAMMAYPAVVFAARARAGWSGPLAGPAGGGEHLRAALTVAGVLAAWDLFLDPQMAAAGYWRWSGPAPALNGVPLVNTAGWLLVGSLLGGLVCALPGRPVAAGADRVPLALLAWTYASSVLANLAFFGRPWVALSGGLGMGCVGIGAVGMGAVLAAVIHAARPPA